MALLPPSTNADYHGARSAVWFLGLAAILTLAPACIHSFAPNGGATGITHLDMGDRRNLVVGVFRWEGATQMALGLAMLVVAIRYQTLTAAFLGFVIVERILMALQGWVLSPPANGHHPPEQYASLVAPPLLLLFMILAMRRRPG
jgi:hypothetical protein